mgnify:CR=1 FL=1
MSEDLLKPYREDLELVKATQSYSLYLNDKTEELFLYNGKDLGSVDIKALGDMVTS